MYKKVLFTFSVLLLLGINIHAQQSYAFNGGVFSYGTIDLTTGLWTTMNFTPQGSSYYPQTGDNDSTDSQYAIMSDFNFPANYHLMHVDFTAMTGDSIAPVGPLATGQNIIKGMAYNIVNDTWYVVSSNDFGNAGYLYTMDINTGVLTAVGQIQNADLPVGMAIDCDGNAYIVNIVIGISGTAVLNSLDLTTAIATPIGTDLGLADASAFSQDMDFNPDNGNLYWCGYWTSGFFSEGGSFRLVDVTTGTSTELAAYGQFNNLTGFNVNALCPLPPPQTAESYVFNGGVFSYGTIDLTTGLFTTMNFSPQGSSQYPAVGDNKEVDAQYAIMSDFSFPVNYSLWHIEFGTMSGDSIAPVGPLAAGQSTIKAMAYDVVADMWYVISGDDFASAAYLYALDITNGTLTTVGQIQNADAPAGMAIDCDGNAYIVNIVGAFSTTAVLNSLNLTTATATAIGTDLGLADASYFNQAMDFDPDNGNLYWCGYWTSGFFSEGGSFRLVDVTTGTSTELAAYGQFNNLNAFNVNAICPTVPVELSSFSANVHKNTVSLKWSTATETNNSGFQVERKSDQSDWMDIGFVPGFGTSTEIHSYTYSDAKLAAGKYTYRLKQVDYDGTYEYSSEVEVAVTIPNVYSLAQNYPNPFNPSTTIEFSIPNSELVNIVVYNALGERVTELVNTILPEGQHKVVFNAVGLASGIYIVKMKAGSFTETRKMNLLK